MTQIDISTLDTSKLKKIGTVSTLIHNLEEVQEQLSGKIDGTTMFYRGHADKDWKLEPGIYRSSKALEKEDYLVHDIIRHCPNDFVNCHSSFEKLVKMQHYDLPTRLLDISMNPLVALYFATCDEMDKDGEFFVFILKDEDISHYDDNWVNILSRISFMPKDKVNVGEDKKSGGIL